MAEKKTDEGLVVGLIIDEEPKSTEKEETKAPVKRARK